MLNWFPGNPVARGIKHLDLTVALYTRAFQCLPASYWVNLEKPISTFKFHTLPRHLYFNSFICSYLVPPQLLLSSAALILRRNERNVTVDCYGYGKPLPIVTWRKGNESIRRRNSTLTTNGRNGVMQMSFNTSGRPWNITTRLYLRTNGITYEEAGNYSCEVFNGVGGNVSTDGTVRVFCKCSVFVDV